MPSPSSLHLLLRFLPGSTEDRLGLVYSKSPGEPDVSFDYSLSDYVLNVPQLLHCC